MNIRNKIINTSKKQVLLSNLYDSFESRDNYSIINCNGFGRLRIFKDFKLHLFKNEIFKKPLNRGNNVSNEFITQVFQVGGCNWRCWYCFVDTKLLEGNNKIGKFFSADELINLFLSEPNQNKIIDISGGQVELVPEWILWLLNSIEKKEMKGNYNIWIEDSLSNFFLWELLNQEEISFIAKFPLAHRICCIKGYNYQSFGFNTNVNSKEFDKQFDVLKKLNEDEFDLFSYATFTTPSIKNLKEDIKEFISRLMNIHPKLPLRIIPLKIKCFSNTYSHFKDIYSIAMDLQYKVVEAWENELLDRFTIDEITKPYFEIKLH